jgi:hypothetical protein
MSGLLEREALRQNKSDVCTSIVNERLNRDGVIFLATTISRSFNVGCG